VPPFWVPATTKLTCSVMPVRHATKEDQCTAQIP